MDLSETQQDNFYLNPVILIFMFEPSNINQIKAYIFVKLKEQRISCIKLKLFKKWSSSFSMIIETMGKVQAQNHVPRNAALEPKGRIKQGKN